MKKEMFPSHLFLSADMWLLSTAIYLVRDLEIEEYDSIVNNPEASVSKEVYQIAVGSFKAGKLELQWDPVEQDYWVNPDVFLQWCIKKSICENSTMLDFYQNTVMKQSPHCLAKVIEEHPGELQEIRKMHPATEAKHRTLALVDYTLSENPEASIDQILIDKKIRKFGRSDAYDDATVRKWIQEAYPQFKKPVGRPPQNH